MARFFTGELGQARGQIHFRKQPRKKNLSPMIDVASDGIRELNLFRSLAGSLTCGCIQNSFCPRCTQDEA